MWARHFIMISRTLVTTMLAGLLTLILGVSGAFAHASLLTTTPAGNALLPAAPQAVEMTFNEPVGILLVTLLGPDGQKRDLTGLTQGGQVVTVPLPDGLPQGTEALTWHIVSADGHPVGGTLIFSIGRSTGATDQEGTEPGLAVAIWLTRALVYVGLFIGAGSLAFCAIAPLPAPVRRLGLTLVGTGTVAAVLSIGLQGADGLGSGLAGLLEAHTWATGWGTTYSMTIVAVLIAYGLGAVSILLPPWPQRVLALLTLLTAGLALALSGHASAADPQWLTRPVVFVHVVGVCFWIGSLLPLGVLMRKGGVGADRALARFSAIIPYALLPLVVAGIALAVVQLGSFGPAWLTPYAAILAAKLVIVLALLLLAAWNRWRLTRAVQAAEATGRRLFVLSVRAEIVLVLVILGLVAGWRFTVPPRAVAEAMASPVQVQAIGGNLMAELLVLPGRVGQTNISVSFMDAKMAPVEPMSVKLSLSQTAAGVGPIEAEATKAADGTWHAASVELPISGDWTVAIDARTGMFDITTLTGSFALPPSTESSMKLPTTLAAAAVSSALLVAPSAATGQGIVDSCPTGQSFTQSGITVSGAFMRATPKGAQSAGAYLVIANTGTADDSFTGASSGAAPDITLHSMKMNGNVMEMAPVDGPLDVPPGGAVRLDPMGYHLMLTGMPQPFVQGQCVAMTLHFAKAGDLPIELNIGGYGQQTAPTDGASSMEMSGMSSMPGM